MSLPNTPSKVLRNIQQGITSKLEGRISRGSFGRDNSTMDSEHPPAASSRNSGSTEYYDDTTVRIQSKLLPTAKELDDLDEKIKVQAAEVGMRQSEFKFASMRLQELQDQRMTLYSGHDPSELVIDQSPMVFDNVETLRLPENVETFQLQDSDGEIDDNSPACFNYKKSYYVADLEDDDPVDDFTPLGSNEYDLEDAYDIMGVAKCRLCQQRMPLDVEAIEAHTEQCELEHGIGGEDYRESVDDESVRDSVIERPQGVSQQHDMENKDSPELQPSKPVNKPEPKKKWKFNFGKKNKGATLSVKKTISTEELKENISPSTATPISRNGSLINSEDTPSSQISKKKIRVSIFTKSKK